jgi:RNA polymerase sigma-70 factor (ECF subfamily)
VTERDADSRGAEEQASLAERIQRGDALAESRLAALFSDRILAVALSRTRDREVARDLAQDALLAVIAALRAGKLRNGDKLAGFVYGTVRNVINNHFRSTARRPPIEPLEPEHAASEDRDLVEDRERNALVREALSQLSPGDRRIVLFTLIDGLKPGEIARRLRLSDEVVRARKSRAVKRIIERVNELAGRSRK